MSRYAPAAAWGDSVRRPGLPKAPDHAVGAAFRPSHALL